MLITDIIKKEIKLGDVLLSFDRKSFISKEITKITSSKFSHAFLYIGMDKILESNPGGVVIRPLSYYLDYDKYYLSLRRPDLTKKKAKKFVKECKKYLGVTYGYMQIFYLWFLYKAGLRENKLFQKDMPGGVICSQLIALGLEKVGWYPFSLIPACVTPEDLAQKLAIVV